MKYKDLLQKERECPFEVRKPEDVILENETAYITYALAPYHKDHLLVVPKRHIEQLLDISDAEMKDIDALEKEGWKLLKKLGYKSVSFIVREGDASGRTLKHIHYHLIPEVRLGDVDHNGDERMILSQEEIAETVARIKSVQN